MQALINRLKINICAPLPGLDAQMIMAPPVRTPVQQAPANARTAAVVILIYPVQEIPHILLMRRTADAGPHSNQISLPGGKYESTDLTLTYTALRELHEEMGVDLQAIKIMGNLTPLYVPPSNFTVMPVLCYATQQLSFIRSEKEVKEIIELPLHDFMNSNNKIMQTVARSDEPSITMDAPTYTFGNDKIIWGATAMMLREFEALCEKR